METVRKIKAKLYRQARQVLAGQGGFTLIELLVVVTILGVLAAVVMTNVSRFATEGELQAALTEYDNVQTGIDAMMTVETLGTVALPPGIGLGTAVNDFSLAGGADFDPAASGIYLYPDYVRNAITGNAYCWNDAGEVTAQTAAAGAACP